MEHYHHRLPNQSLRSYAEISKQELRRMLKPNGNVINKTSCHSQAPEQNDNFFFIPSFMHSDYKVRVLFVLQGSHL